MLIKPAPEPAANPGGKRSLSFSAAQAHLGKKPSLHGGRAGEHSGLAVPRPSLTLLGGSAPGLCEVLFLLGFCLHAPPL